MLTDFDIFTNRLAIPAYFPNGSACHRFWTLYISCLRAKRKKCLAMKEMPSTKVSVNTIPHDKPHTSLAAARSLMTSVFQVALFLVAGCNPVFSQPILVQGTGPAPSHGKGGTRTRYEINRVDGLCSSYSDYLALDRGKTLMVITKAGKRHIGEEDVRKYQPTNYKLYRIERKGPDWIGLKIKRLHSRYGKSIYDIGYACGDSSRGILTTEVAPLPPSSQYKGKGFTDIPKVIAVGWGSAAEAESLTKHINAGDPAWSSTNPVMHSCGCLAIFSSNRPDTADQYAPKPMTGFNLHMVVKRNGLWSAVEIMDTLINTNGEELFPSFLGDDLYFASNGRPDGMGGFDIYKTHIDLSQILSGAKTNRWEKAVPLPEGFNSTADDYWVVWSKAAVPSGFISSTRQGNGDADIFSFVIKHTAIVGNVASFEDAAPIANASVCLINTRLDSSWTTTDAKGWFGFPAKYNQGFQLLVRAEGYEDRPLLSFSTIVVEPGGDKDVGQVLLKPKPHKVVVLHGEILPLGKYSNPQTTKVKVCCDYSNKEYYMTMKDSGSFSMNIVENEDFYLDVEMSDGSRTTWHHRPGMNFDPATDLVRMPVTPLVDSIAVLHAFSQVPIDTKEVPSAYLLLYGQETDSFVVIGYEKGDSTGRLRIPIPSSMMSNCSLVVTMPGCVPAVYNLNRETAPDSILLMTRDQLLFEPIHIFHPYNQSKEDTSLISRTNLDRIARFMMLDSTAMLIISSHTDCRGSSKFNDTLSFRRGRYIVEYIQRYTGVPKERFEVRGWGEKKPANRCVDGVPCSEGEHRDNRRTDIILNGLKEYSMEGK